MLKLSWGKNCARRLWFFWSGFQEWLSSSAMRVGCMGFQIVDCGLKICDHWCMARPAGMADDNKPSKQLHPLLQSIAAQLMNGAEVVIREANGDEQRLKVTRIGSGRLRTVRVRINGREIQAIEQNRSKPSRWGDWRGRASGGAVSGCCDKEVSGGGRWMGKCLSMGGELVRLICQMHRSFGSPSLLRATSLPQNDSRGRDDVAG